MGIQESAQGRSPPTEGFSTIEQRLTTHSKKLFDAISDAQKQVLKQQTSSPGQSNGKSPLSSIKPLTFEVYFQLSSDPQSESYISTQGFEILRVLLKQMRDKAGLFVSGSSRNQNPGENIMDFRFDPDNRSIHINFCEVTQPSITNIEILKGIFNEEQARILEKVRRVFAGVNRFFDRFYEDSRKKIKERKKQGKQNDPANFTLTYTLEGELSESDFQIVKELLKEARTKISLGAKPREGASGSRAATPRRSPTPTRSPRKSWSASNTPRSLSDVMDFTFDPKGKTVKIEFINLSSEKMKVDNTLKDALMKGQLEALKLFLKEQRKQDNINKRTEHAQWLINNKKFTAKEMVSAIDRFIGGLLTASNVEFTRLHENFKSGSGNVSEGVDIFTVLEKRYKTAAEDKENIKRTYSNIRKNALPIQPDEIEILSKKKEAADTASAQKDNVLKTILDTLGEELTKQLLTKRGSALGKLGWQKNIDANNAFLDALRYIGPQMRRTSSFTSLVGSPLQDPAVPPPGATEPHSPPIPIPPR